MIKKISKIFFIYFFFLANCGYSPIYTGINNTNFELNIVEMYGVRVVNNQIKSKLNRYSLDGSDEKLDIVITSKYTKNITAKDTTGAATEYKIVLEVIFKVDGKEFDEEFTFDESFNLQSMADKLDEKNYEDNLRNNSINIIIQKLILKLIRNK
tara:strand:+ start:194 stop:655 length:462 start_codon:yes stop_codon:yes gene_type:complete